MTNLLRQLLIILGFTIAGAGYYIYTHPRPCTSPLTYRIGSFNTSFGISEADFIEAAKEAEAVWETPTGKDLFAYSEKGKLPINLVYDDRQKTTERNKVLDANIEQNKDTAAGIKQQYTALQAQYAQDEASYTSALATFTKHSEAYSSQVSYWNSRGGAPKSEYEALNEQKANLENERATVETMRTNLNTLSADINALIARYNTYVGKINSNVDVINSSAGADFDEGIYSRDAQGARITIYEFGSRTKLVRVLAHELGHALGLDHNSNRDSIMYAVNQSTSLVPTQDDLDALHTLCGA